MNKYKLFARFIANGAVRNTYLEDLHAGKTLPKKYQVGYSRISDPEMRKLMLEVEKQIAWFLAAIEEGNLYGKQITQPELLKVIKKCFFGQWGISWDIPNKKYQELLNVKNTSDSGN